MKQNKTCHVSSSSGILLILSPFCQDLQIELDSLHHLWPKTIVFIFVFSLFSLFHLKKNKIQSGRVWYGAGGAVEFGSINPIKINLITVWLNYLEQVVDPFDIEWQQINKYFKLGYQNFTASIFIGFASENLIERRANLFSFFRCCCCFFININKTMKKNTNKSN